MNEQYDFLYPSDYHEDEIVRAPWYPTDDLIKAAALNLLILDRYERKMRNGLDNGNAVLLFDSEEARDANDLTHAKPMLVDRDSVADKELLLDTETGMRPVLLIDPLTGEKKIGYTEFLIPGYQEVVIDGIATGSYKDADGNPTKNEKGELYKYPDTRKKYEDDKEYFDSLPAEDRALLLSYLRAKEAISNGVTSFIDEEAPQVYKDYLNRLTSQAYEPIDNLAWLAGPLSTPYYGLRTGLDVARGEWGDALENGVFTALPWASKVGGALVKNASPFVKEVVGLNAIGAPVTAYNAYNYGPEGAVTTAAMFTAMPMLGEAIKAADMPGVAKSLATLVLDAGERGVEGYKALSRQLSTIYKNVSPEIKKLILDAIDFCNVAIESHDDFGYMNPGGMRTSPAMVKVRTVDGRTIEIPAETANTYLNEGRGSILVNPKESITQNGFIDKTKEWAGKIGDAYNEGMRRLGNAANALKGKKSETESVEPVESKAKEEINSGTEGLVENGKDNSLNANTGNSTTTLEPREQSGEAGGTGEEIELKKVNEDNIKQDDNIEQKQPVTSELIKELGRARIANENGDAEILEKLDLNKVKNRRGSEKDAYIERDGKKIPVKTIYEDEVLPSSLNDDFEKLNAMINLEIDPSKRTIGLSFPTVIKGTAGTKLSKYPDYNSVRETNIEAIKSTNGKVKKNTYRIIESDLNELTKGIKVEYTESGLSIAKDTSGWKNLTKKLQEKIDDLFAKLKDLYTKMGFDLSSLNGSSYTFYDLMYPLFGKCRPLKRAIKELNSKKYITEYDKKLGNDSYKGWIEDGIWSALGAGAGYVYSPDPLSTAVNTTTAIGGAVALPFLVRGLQRRGAFARSPLGSSINKVLPDRVAPYYQKTPERFLMLDKVPGIIKYGIPGLIIGGGAIGKRNLAVNHGYDSTLSMFVPWHDYESGNTPNNDPMEVYYSDEEIKELNNK